MKKKDRRERERGGIKGERVREKERYNKEEKQNFDLCFNNLNLLKS